MMKDRGSVIRCKPCVNPHDSNNRPRYLLTGFIEYVWSSVSDNHVPFHATVIDVEPHMNVQLLGVDSVVTHQFVKVLGGACGAVRHYGFA